jgi:hypothetical protein
MSPDPDVAKTFPHIMTLAFGADLLRATGASQSISLSYCGFEPRP